MADLAIRITASDAASSVFDKLKGNLNDLASAATAPLKGLLSLGQGIGMLGVAVGGLTTLGKAVADVATGMVSGNAEFERYESQFSVLLGSTKAAKDRLAELSEFGAKTPFELPELVRADKVLTAFGLDSATTAKKFGVSAAQIRTTIGDVAAGTGAGFEELSTTFGKFASGSTGDAIARFQELGIATRDQMAAMGMEFSKTGELLTPADKAFAMLEAGVRQKFGGMMDAQSNTFEGMASNLSDWLGATKRQLMVPVFEVLKDKLKGLLEMLNGPAAKAAIEGIGKTLAAGVTTAVGAVDWLIRKVGELIGYLDPNNKRDVMREWFGDAGPVIDGVVRGVKGIVEAIGGLASTGDAGGFVGKLFGPNAQTLFQSFERYLGVLIPAAVKGLSVAWSEVLQPALTKVGEFINGTVFPALSKMYDWLATNIPIAVQKASDFWNNTLRPAIESVSVFVTETVIPALSSVYDWLATNIPTAVQSVSDAFTTTLIPGLTKVTEWIGTNIPKAVQTGSDAFTKTLLPAADGIVKVFRDYLIPFGDALVGTLGALGNLIIITLEPAARAVWGVLSDLAKTISDALMPAVESASAPGGPLYAIGQAFQWILDRVRDLTGWLRGLEEAINRLSGKSVNVGVSTGGAVPGYATGGTVPGPVGRPQLAVVHGGETITPPGQGFGGGGAVTINLGGITINGNADAGTVYQAANDGVLSAIRSMGMGLD